ncbi:MAG: ATP-binding protein [Azoarcus sp.]|jgi:predicted ATPase|nr:ATP-binding protein [Azoarcus sp.]
MSDVLIHGIYLKSFKGIGDNGVRLAPLQKMNFLVGPNNSGKSSILQFLARYLHGKRDGEWSRNYVQEDIPIGKHAGDVKFGFGKSIEIVQQALPKAIPAGLIGQMEDKDGFVWVTPDANGRAICLLDWDMTSAEKFLSEPEWNKAWIGLTNGTGGDKSDWIPLVLRTVARIVSPTSSGSQKLPKVRLIPAIRQISGGDSLEDSSGSGLINELAKLQNPDFHNQEQRSIFRKIEQFVRSVTGVGDTDIEVPYERTHLVVRMGGKALPLSALGTGIHEIVMLAAFCTLAENEIVCLEEPEIHLHPLLQRKLIRYLHGKTSNQYFIATHSSAMLNVVPSAVFAVTQQHDETHIRIASTLNDKFEICRTLGYQASDLLQSNAIIWVEGPSDRVYLLHWIKAVAPDLVEGIDFSVMFYGGRLLSHLSAEDEEVGEFIALRRLNRNVAVVMDSDKSSSHACVNATKKRIIAELGQDGFVWLTAGREIENYIPPSLLENAVCSVSGIESSQPRSMGQYDHAYKYKDKKGHEFVADKIKIARAVAAKKADLSVLDLRKRVDELVAFIRNSSAQGRHDGD